MFCINVESERKKISLIKLWGKKGGGSIKKKDRDINSAL
jgi:hypothetical protein